MSHAHNELAKQQLAGRKVIITTGSTHEPLGDHYIAKNSSSNQGYTLAAAAVVLGAEVILISAPANQPLPPGVQLMPVSTGAEMLRVCERDLPCHVVIFAAEVARWRLDPTMTGLPEANSRVDLTLVPNPNIVKSIATRTDKRPTIVVEFGSGTENIIEEGKKRQIANRCDLVVMRDISTQTLIGPKSTVHLIWRDSVTAWRGITEQELARQLTVALAQILNGSDYSFGDSSNEARSAASE
jgi:phosphopantothenoylcysteine decarboxylase/phosphopantothenate--cysteine ligase